MAKRKKKKMICYTSNGKKECVKAGDALYTSWGYDQTNVDFCRIESISPTGKTLKCQRVFGSLISRDRGVDYVAPSTKSINCPPVRLRVSKWKGKNTGSFAGSYPFLSNIRRKEDCESKRLGYFSKYTKPVYETAPGYGH